MPDRPDPLLLARLLDGSLYGPLLQSAEVKEHRRAWRELFGAMRAYPPQDGSVAERFHTQWHVSHHFIRELVADDALLTDALWAWLPRYSGPGLPLYRGENIDRFEAGSLGSAWTNDPKTARMFARGLNAVGKGGVLLSSVVPSDAIIAGPSKHSLYLGEFEYAIDIRRLGRVDAMERFAAA